MGKVCFKCGERKPLSCFYAHPEMADGHLGKCKECTKADVRANRVKRLDRYRAYDRERYYERGPRGTPSSDGGARSQKWRSRNRDKQRAHSRVQHAIARGEIERPGACQSCGKECVPHAHHHDYTKPLEVKWVCSSCHGLEHRRYTREENRALLKSG